MRPRTDVAAVTVVTVGGSMYARVGGAPTVRRVVDWLCCWILADDRLRARAGTDLGRLKGHVRALLSQALGGPTLHNGCDVARMFASLGFTEEDYQRVADYLVAALSVEHAGQDVIDAVTGVFAAFGRHMAAAGSFRSVDPVVRPPDAS